MTAVDVASRPGVWKRAGQAAMPCGLDWTQVAILLPAGCDRDGVLELMREFEAGLIEGASETAKRHADEAKRNAK